MRIPRVSGISTYTDCRVYGYLCVLERYNQYYIMENYKVIKEGDTLPIHRVDFSSIVIEDIVNTSWDFPYVGYEYKTKDILFHLGISNHKESNNKKEKIMNRVQIINNDSGYEGLYVNGKLVEEGNPLNGGYERVTYFLNLAKKYDVNIGQITFGSIDGEDELPEFSDWKGING